MEEEGEGVAVDDANDDEEHATGNVAEDASRAFDLRTFDDDDSNAKEKSIASSSRGNGGCGIGGNESKNAVVEEEGDRIIPECGKNDAGRVIIDDANGESDDNGDDNDDDDVKEDDATATTNAIRLVVRTKDRDDDAVATDGGDRRPRIGGGSIKTINVGANEDIAATKANVVTATATAMLVKARKKDHLSSYVERLNNVKTSSNPYASSGGPKRGVGGVANVTKLATTTTTDVGSLIGILTASGSGSCDYSSSSESLMYSVGGETVKSICVVDWMDGGTTGR